MTRLFSGVAIVLMAITYLAFFGYLFGFVPFAPSISVGFTSGLLSTLCGAAAFRFHRINQHVR